MASAPPTAASILHDPVAWVPPPPRRAPPGPRPRRWPRPLRPPVYGFGPEASQIRSTWPRPSAPFPSPKPRFPRLLWSPSPPRAATAPPSPARPPSLTARAVHLQMLYTGIVIYAPALILNQGVTLGDPGRVTRRAEG